MILLLYTVHMVLNLLKCSRNAKIIFVYFQTTFKEFFKICLIFSHNIKNFKLSQICFKILQISKTFEYGLYIHSFILCYLSSKMWRQVIQLYQLFRDNSSVFVLIKLFNKIQKLFLS